MKQGTGIVRFANAAAAIAQGYSFPDKLKDRDATPKNLKGYQEWIRYQNREGQVTVPVWLDDVKIVQMYPPK